MQHTVIRVGLSLFSPTRVFTSSHQGRGSRTDKRSFILPLCCEQHPGRKNSISNAWTRHLNTKPHYLTKTHSHAPLRGGGVGWGVNSHPSNGRPEFSSYPKLPLFILQAADECERTSLGLCTFISCYERPSVIRSRLNSDEMTRVCLRRK
ncbi:hypothetical protein CDAR_546761 [Caerostris darwini]|uniref:Secreted protein n=1 Tax=Caerostris darwini TaxID=1538125 RepID=A0AAV4WTL3_9ARAC|nr:hypothetical protein CDAR_546761 [Caerostris darwini]